MIFSKKSIQYFPSEKEPTSTLRNEVTEASFIPYQQTGYLSKIITDYLNEEEQLKPFYQYPVSLQGIKEAIEVRKKTPSQRNVLIHELKLQYQQLEVALQVKQNLELLLHENTFTITTAHQPNIFTGPLFFIYKILHTIKLANHLSKELTAYNFVPVFYMGSEDADLDELGHISIHNQAYNWNTKQTGAVGRMKVDKAFLALMESMYGQVGVGPYGEQIITVFKKYYKESVTIQQATLQVVNELFGEYGLVILIPDNANLKKLFNSVVKKELTELFSYHQVNATLSQLKTNYKVQAGGRELNLFYLINDKRERIEVSGNRFQVTGLKLSFSLDEIFSEVENHPERFSPNVILRGVFQETILPNIAFIGGGGELAYWLELKKAFEEASIPYPVLVLRNSFLLVTQQLQQKIKKLGFNIVDFFKEEQALLNELVKRTSTKQLDLQKEREQLQALYQQLKNVSSKIDTTLNPHIEALQIKADKRLEDLEKKMLRTERKKFEAQQRQIHKIKNQLFPDDNLQERVENVSGFYAAYGKYFFDLLLANSLSFEQQFAIVTLPDSM